jgi:hypothetical protein
MNNRELMLHRIIHALNQNVHGLLTGKTHSIIPDERANSDLRFASYQELDVLLDNDDEMERMFKFFNSLREMEGFEYAEKKHAELLKDYPNVTKYLTISVYC